MANARYVIQINGLEPTHDETYISSIVPDAVNIWIARNNITHEHCLYGFVEFETNDSLSHGSKMLREQIKGIRITVYPTCQTFETSNGII